MCVKKTKVTSGAVFLGDSFPRLFCPITPALPAATALSSLLEDILATGSKSLRTLTFPVSSIEFLNLLI